MDGTSSSDVWVFFFYRHWGRTKTTESLATKHHYQQHQKYKSIYSRPLGLRDHHQRHGHSSIKACPRLDLFHRLTIRSANLPFSRAFQNHCHTSAPRICACFPLPSLLRFRTCIKYLLKLLVAGMLWEYFRSDGFWILIRLLVILVPVVAIALLLWSSCFSVAGRLGGLWFLGGWYSKTRNPYLLYILS